MEKNLQEHHLVKLKGNEFLEFFSFSVAIVVIYFYSEMDFSFCFASQPDVSFLTIRSCNC